MAKFVLIEGNGKLQNSKFTYFIVNDRAAVFYDFNCGLYILIDFNEVSTGAI